MGLKVKIGLVMLGAALKTPALLSAIKRTLENNFKRAQEKEPPLQDRIYRFPARTNPPMSNPEHKFRLEHCYHTLLLKDSSASGIGISTQISCLDCNTGFQDVTDVEIW